MKKTTKPRGSKLLLSVTKVRNLDDSALRVVHGGQYGSQGDGNIGTACNGTGDCGTTNQCGTTKLATGGGGGAGL